MALIHGLAREIYGSARLLIQEERLYHIDYVSHCQALRDTHHDFSRMIHDDKNRLFDMRDKLEELDLEPNGLRIDDLCILNKEMKDSSLWCG